MTRKTRKEKPTRRFAGVLIGLLLLAISPFTGRAFNDATSPPYYDPAVIAPFLNGSNFAQRVSGDLVIGERNGRLPKCTTTDDSGCSKLCLNPRLQTGESDTTSATACVTSWSAVRDLISNLPYVRLLTSEQVDPPATPPVDGGYIRLQGKPGLTSVQGYTSAELITLMVEAPDPSPANPAPIGLQATARVNASYAAIFANGTLAVQPLRHTTNGVVDGGLPVANPKICLNGIIDMVSPSNPGGHCITAWNQLWYIKEPTVIRLQDTNSNASLWSPDAGGGAVMGMLLAPAAVIGEPTFDVPALMTGGDGVCHPDLENPTTSPLDCY